MRLPAFLLVAVTAAALVGAGPVRCVVTMPAAPAEAPCHQAPPVPDDTPGLPLGAACCAAPTATPGAPTEAPLLVAAAVPAPRSAVATVRQTAPSLRRRAEPPERPPGAPLALLGCFRI